MKKVSPVPEDELSMNQIMTKKISPVPEYELNMYVKKNLESGNLLDYHSIFEQPQQN